MTEMYHPLLTSVDDSNIELNLFCLITGALLLIVRAAAKPHFWFPLADGGVLVDLAMLTLE